MRHVLAASLLLVSSVPAAAEPTSEPTPLLTKPGKLLFSEDFSEVPHERDRKNKTKGGWMSGKGRWAIKDGVLAR